MTKITPFIIGVEVVICVFVTTVNMVAARN